MSHEDPAQLGIAEEYTKAATILLRGYLRLYILEQLRSRPQAGSEIVSGLMSACAWKPSPGTIYPMLRRLEREGMVESRWDTSSKPRRVYTITEEGSRERMRLREKLEPQLRRTLKMLQLHIDYLFGEERG